jgi:hypothetical protein
MVNKEEKIRKRDDKLLKKEKSWRRARIGAIFLSIFHVLVLVMLQFDKFSLPKGQKKFIVGVGIYTLFLFFVVSELNLRLGHIESIKLYRKKESEAVKQ